MAGERHGRGMLCVNRPLGCFVNLPYFLARYVVVPVMDFVCVCVCVYVCVEHMRKQLIRADRFKEYLITANCISAARAHHCFW